jgi:hypothetical protein
MTAQPSAASANRPAADRTARICSRVLLALAAIALAYCVFWAFGPRAVDLGNHHCGTVVSNYLHPQTLDPQLEAGSFADPARMCNTDAVRQLHRIYLFVAISAGLLLAAVLFKRRSRPT